MSDIHFHFNSFTQSEVVPAILPFYKLRWGEDASHCSSELEAARDHRRLAANAIFPSVFMTTACLISQGLSQTITFHSSNNYYKIDHSLNFINCWGKREGAIHTLLCVCSILRASHYVAGLAWNSLIDQATWNCQRFACFWLPSTRIKGVHHHVRPSFTV